MMVPIISDSQLGRLRRAYYTGTPSEDLAERFGISAATIHDMVKRGHMPMITNYGEPISCDVLEIKNIRKKREKACHQHLMDLVAVYRPEVLKKYKERQYARRKVTLSKSELVARNENQTEDAVEREPIIEPRLTRRSFRIFSAAKRHFGFTHDEFAGQAKMYPLVLARQITMFVICSECSKYESTVSIGKMFNKDHSTVVHATHKIRALVQAGDTKIIEHVNALREVK